MRVRIENLYYLLCYAWDRLEAQHFVDRDALAADRPADLFAKVLMDGLRHLIRRGIDRGYVAFEEDTRRPRGKLDLVRTMSRCLDHAGRVHCHVDELSHDVLHNQILKSVMLRLGAAKDVDRGLRGDLRLLARQLNDVSEVPLRASLFGMVQLHRNNAFYGFLLDVAQLVYRNLLVEEKTGAWRFRDFTGDEREMGLLFEAFVRNFLRREQTAFRVGRQRIPWDAAPIGGSDATLLPGMHTDITLTRPGQRIVVETKCVQRTLVQGAHGAAKFRSDHLYQLHAYLSNLDRDGGPPSRGVLLYAEAERPLHQRFRIGGRDVIVRTVSLDQDWRGVRAELLRLVTELASEHVAIDRTATT